MPAPDPLPALDEPTVIFVINRAWSPGDGEDETYAATRGYWKVGAQTRDRAVFALGVAGGIVRGAYRIVSWHRGPAPGRWGFEGTPATELDAVGKSVAHLALPRGAANPVRLHLNGTPPPPFRAGPVGAVAHALNREPLARIMYGQRELFHSNFLAWFFDELPDLADQVFRDLTVAGDGDRRSVERERENLDLVMSWPGAAPLVIENKVFSLPDGAQLAEYRAKTARWKGTPAEHVLLSMNPPPTTVEGWRLLSYRELADRIDHALVAVTESSYEVESLRRYSRVVRLLSGLLDTTVVRSLVEGAWLDPTQLSEIDSAQTQSALKKLRARRVQIALDEHGPQSGWTEADISHSQPLVGWRKHLTVEGHDIQAGWQYQEGQFRLCLVLPHLAGRSDEAKRAREAFAAAHPELFDFSPIHNLLNTPRAAEIPATGVRHFSPDFVYRYVKAPGLTVAQLVHASLAIDEALTRRGSVE